MYVFLFRYLLGNTPFATLPDTLLCRPPVLIPRPETEQWVLWLAERLLKSRQLKDTVKGRMRVLDLCSGSGCVALALAHQVAGLDVLGLDISTAAVRLAIDNSARMRKAVESKSSSFGGLPTTKTISYNIEWPWLNFGTTELRTTICDQDMSLQRINGFNSRFFSVMYKTTSIINKHEASTTHFATADLFGNEIGDRISNVDLVYIYVVFCKISCLISD